MIKKNSHNPESTSQEICNCRAVDIGISDFAECLRSGPNSCTWALPFGYAFLCRHPRLGEILQNTSESTTALKADQEP